jgi:hypothetical protein
VQIDSVSPPVVTSSDTAPVEIRTHANSMDMIPFCSG